MNSTLKELPFKKYGRVNTNVLDWLLAFAFCALALGAIWLCIGISIFHAGEGAVEAFLIFARGLGFVLSPDNTGFVVSLLTSLFFYGSVLYVVAGCVYFKQNKIRDKYVGLFAELVAIASFLVLFAFAFEFFKGTYAYQLNNVWPIVLILVLAILLCIAVSSIVLTFKKNADLSLPFKLSKVLGSKEAEPAKENEAK